MKREAGKGGSQRRKIAEPSERASRLAGTNILQSMIISKITRGGFCSLCAKLIAALFDSSPSEPLLLPQARRNSVPALLPSQKT